MHYLSSYDKSCNDSTAFTESCGVFSKDDKSWRIGHVLYFRIQCLFIYELVHGHTCIYAVFIGNEFTTLLRFLTVAIINAKNAKNVFTPLQY